MRPKILPPPPRRREAWLAPEGKYILYIFSVTINSIVVRRYTITVVATRDSIESVVGSEGDFTAHATVNMHPDSTYHRPIGTNRTKTRHQSTVMKYLAIAQSYLLGRRHALTAPPDASGKMNLFQVSSATEFCNTFSN